ncbi:alkaline-phosphatase-like protein [Sordaria sp. MPI-SDFR-AT-0083]|nr:alkaline-phosphatase-like protein [Sordaria sp. MPI-SDFR-AT-0083]
MRFSAAALVAGLQVSAALVVDGEQKPLGFQQKPKGTATKGNKQPNIVFTLTDDQDLHLQSLDYLPLIKKCLADEGTTYKRHYCTTAICCPARVSLWTGKQAHNTNVTDVLPPYGGLPKFISQGFNEAYLPVWLQEAGYDTYYTGKLFNAHTVDNYDSPYLAGWNGSDFLLDPYTYSYLNATFQRNRDAPVSYEGQYSVDVLAEKAYRFLDDAAQNVHKGGRPFFLGIAPIAPHSNVEPRIPSSAAGALHRRPTSEEDDIEKLVSFTPPIPAARHAHLFPDVVVPRTPHFNPSSRASGVSWISQLPVQSAENVAFNDHFYRQRLRTLQSVDELVAGVIERLERHGLLEDTYVFYTTDNGYHIGQHRLQPGKECGFEEDINVPLIVRGPGVKKGAVAEVVTSHVDLAPTVLKLAGALGGDDDDDNKKVEEYKLDGEAIPLTAEDLEEAKEKGERHEHVTVEYWGFALSEGRLFGKDATRFWTNNTYKAVRILGDGYNLYYSVWCSGEHELYDLQTDPYQLNNLLAPSSLDSGNTPSSLLGVPFQKVVVRLDSLLFVLKSCKGKTCIRPWEALHPAGNVRDLHDALSSRFDTFYEKEQRRVAFDRCEKGYIVEAEGPQFETHGLVYRDGHRWDQWV